MGIDARLFFSQFGQQANSVEAWHLQVRDHDGRLPGQRLFPAFDAVARSLSPVSPSGDEFRESQQRVGLVFDNQDLRRVLHMGILFNLFTLR